MTDYPSQPERVFNIVNQRILDYTTASQFVTIFYGILDLENGEMVYCNAGHCPPLLVRKTKVEPFQELKLTGIPLGVYKQESWVQRVEVLEPGDFLVMYTDGITDAENARHDPFGEQNLRGSISKLNGKESKEILEGILLDVENFTGETPQYDDITLGVVKRTLE
jgi:sigma-B regulation protein RsbU (phosphoserine phosphatase)